MYVCWDVHQDTYLDIWVRRVIIIKDACYVLLLCLLWTPVMLVMIPVMPVMYSCYDRCVIATNAFHRILLRISGFMIIIILVTHTLFYYPCSIPSVFCSYLIIPWVLPAWYHLLYIYLPIHAYAHDTVFNAYLRLGFIDTHVLSYARHLAFASPLAWGVLTPLDPHVQVLELGECRSLERVDSPSWWSEWRSGSLDLQQTIWSSILPGPLCASRVFLL